MTRDERVAEMMPIIRRLVAKKNLHPSNDPEDIISAAMVSVVKAADDWDESRGVPWTAYATQKAKWAIDDELRSHTRRSNMNTLNRVKGGGVHVPSTPDPAKVAEAREVVLSGRAGTVFDSLPSPSEVVDRVTQLREAMYGAITTEDVIAVMQSVIRKARDGNTSAAKLLVEMLSPARGGTRIVQQQAIVISGDDIQ